jgi:hypothetical protein
MIKNILIFQCVHSPLHMNMFLSSIDSHSLGPISLVQDVYSLQHSNMYLRPMDNHFAEPFQDDLTNQHDDISVHITGSQYYDSILTLLDDHVLQHNNIYRYPTDSHFRGSISR